MVERSPKILIVEPDPDILEMLVASLGRRFDAHVTCVADADSCLDVELVDPHDLIILELRLRDVDNVQLAARLTALSSRPLILLSAAPTCKDAIEAMRLGVRDLFRKPFEMEDLLVAVDRALTGNNLQRQRAAKYRRMRDLVRRVIRERRDLSRRTELVCRDLVNAHRRLVQRVLNLEDRHARPSA